MRARRHAYVCLAAAAMDERIVRSAGTTMISRSCGAHVDGLIFMAQTSTICCAMFLCRSGGIGIHAGFKNPWGQPHESSSLSSGTNAPS